MPRSSTRVLCSPAGGSIVAPSLLSASVLNGALTTGLLEANTQGAGDQSRSQATVENFILNVGGNTFTGVLVADASQCTCTGGGFHRCEGGVMIAILRINGVQIPIAGINQTVNLPGGGFVIINEQILTGSGNTGSITVNGVRIFIPSVIPGTPAVADVILAQAHSDIVCATQ
ncbi:MAG: choice-of-anchor P family protein [Pyrinomonadaceae bacterium]